MAEEVTVKGADAKANTKRPDIVLYVNGIALGVLELKRSKVAVNEGIRQNLDNQKAEFIQPFFSTMQYVMAGNDSQGLRYGTIQTGEKYYLTGKRKTRTAPLPTICWIGICFSCATRRAFWS
ncbi:type I restriction endonuclease [Halopseudomonas pachastrellae]|nr:type I restriction endonuclease [Halopseudomonas pachastrellae]